MTYQSSWFPIESPVYHSARTVPAALSALLWKHSGNDFPREHNQHFSPWTFSKHPQPHILSIYDARPSREPFPSWSSFFKDTPPAPHPYPLTASPPLSLLLLSPVAHCRLPEVASVQLKACFDWSFWFLLSTALITGHGCWWHWQPDVQRNGEMFRNCGTTNAHWLHYFSEFVSR